MGNYTLYSDKLVELYKDVNDDIHIHVAVDSFTQDTFKVKDLIKMKSKLDRKTKALETIFHISHTPMAVDTDIIFKLAAEALKDEPNE